jgi:hypothetical protein
MAKSQERTRAILHGLTSGCTSSARSLIYLSSQSGVGGLPLSLFGANLSPAAIVISCAPGAVELLMPGRVCRRRIGAG